MLRIDLISVHPELLVSPLSHSIVQRAQDKGLLDIHIHDLRQYGLGKYRKVDDYQYGGGAGMVLMIEPVERIISALKKQRKYDEIMFFTPDGNLFDQRQANALSLKKNLIMLCGHYKGVDERIREHLISMEISVGNYVLTGGEIPAALVCDSIARLLPGALGDETSALEDSFQDHLLAPPVFTRPAEYKGWKVPEVLLNGDKKAIESWRMEQALERTKKRRPGLLDK